MIVKGLIGSDGPPKLKPTVGYIQKKNLKKLI
jgi:hypothetical protein